MAFITLNYYSEALGMQTQVDVLIPQRETEGEIGIESKADGQKYKCLYLLHGCSDDQTIWMRRTSVERYASKYGVAVVMPFAARSYYSDMKYGEKYYQFIAKELPRTIQEFFNISDKREDNYVCGLSMGGYGALKVGLRECDNFCAAAGLSAVTTFEGRYDWRILKNVFGDPVEIPDDDRLDKLALKQAENPNRPKVFIGCGTEDSLYKENLQFRKMLEDLGYDVTYRESSGEHSWNFWDEYIQYVLEWMFG
ncbi:MAG: esterase family protein [Clostridia bacterium]|nr:esterase family protein [Clostridia bacterium]